MGRILATEKVIPGVIETLWILPLQVKIFIQGNKLAKPENFNETS